MTVTPAHGNGAVAQDTADRHFRRNSALLVAEAAAFMCGLAFFDSSTVYPVLLRKLGASDSLIGMTRLVQVLGFTLPALVAAHYIHGRTHHKRFMLTTCAIARVGLFTIPLVLLVADTNPTLALAWTISVTGVFWMMDGACAVSWFDIVAKSIPARVRGRFFGVMQLSAGLAAAGAGLVVASVLHSPEWPFPLNFALLGGLWFVGAMGSQLGLSMIVEPAASSDQSDDRPTFRQYLRQAAPMLRNSPRIRMLIVTRVLLDGAGIAAPFYVLFAQRDLGVSLQLVGLYTVAQSVGRIAAGPLWGWLTDRFGTTTGVRGIAMTIACTPILALIASKGAPCIMFVVFGLLGAVMDGVWMVMSTALLGAASETERPLAVGVASVCQTPSALYGPIGGAVASVLGYQAVFAAAAGVSIGGALASFAIPPSTRARPQAPHEERSHGEMDPHG